MTGRRDHQRMVDRPPGRIQNGGQHSPSAARHLPGDPDVKAADIPDHPHPAVLQHGSARQAHPVSPLHGNKTPLQLLLEGIQGMPGQPLQQLGAVFTADRMRPACIPADNALRADKAVLAAVDNLQRPPLPDADLLDPGLDAARQGRRSPAESRRQQRQHRFGKQLLRRIRGLDNLVVYHIYMLDPHKYDSPLLF
ncbi:hypothetical protein D3C75_933280 [compost metagenome]